MFSRAQDAFVRTVVDMELDERILYIKRALREMPAGEASSASPQTVSDRRKAARVRMPERSSVQLQLRDADLLNISPLGVLVEHTRPAWPGQIYHLSIPVQGVQVQLLARAVHATASNRITSPGGEGQVVYRTGMEFVVLKDGTTEFLSTYISHLRQQEEQAR